MERKASHERPSVAADLPSPKRRTPNRSTSFGRPTGNIPSHELTNSQLRCRLPYVAILRVSFSAAAAERICWPMKRSRFPVTSNKGKSDPEADRQSTAGVQTQELASRCSAPSVLRSRCTTRRRTGCLLPLVSSGAREGVGVAPKLS